MNCDGAENRRDSSVVWVFKLESRYSSRPIGDHSSSLGCRISRCVVYRSGNIESSSPSSEGMNCGVSIGESKPCGVIGLDDALNVGVAGATGVRNVEGIGGRVFPAGMKGVCGDHIGDCPSVSWSKGEVWLLLGAEGVKENPTNLVKRKRRTRCTLRMRRTQRVEMNHHV